MRGRRLLKGRGKIVVELSKASYVGFRAVYVGEDMGIRECYNTYQPA